MASPLNNNKKVTASIMAAALFFVIASPVMYGIVNGVLGSIVRIVGSNGAPTIAGLILHSIVYGLLSYALMHINI